MLVSESVAQRMYSKDSIIYRGFKFLYQNPLYEKKMPTRYAICPMFWQAMFSIFIFMPVIYLAILPCRFLLFKFWKVLQPVDKFGVTFFRQKTYGSEYYGTGIAVVLGVLIGTPAV